MLSTAVFHDPLPLTNAVQRYDWGSRRAIPELLGIEPDGGPYAELWLGAHASNPSVTTAHRTKITLDALLHEVPVQTLGHRVAEQFGPRLPFLLKVLAADRALSLQVHPSARQAREGFAREHKTGIAADAAERSFRDDQHKPEMLVAVTQFEGLAGFRAPRTILQIMEGLQGRLVDDVRRSILEDRSDRGMRAAFDGLVSARGDAGCAADIAATVGSVRDRLTDGSPYARADQAVVTLAEQHPGDPGAIASLMLNRVSLEPGDALFVPAGEVHAYLSGLGVEIMASSDNVLRAGLTTKRVDQTSLAEIASFSPRRPATPEITTSGRRGQVHTYRVPVTEFALTVADVDASEPVVLASTGPRIVLCLDGDVELAADRSDGGKTALHRGESVFVPHDAGNLEVTGNGHVVCAWVP